MLTVELDTLGLEVGAAVLDLGCGRGRHMHALQARTDLRIVGVDLSLADLEAARAGLTSDTAALCVGDTRHLPFGDAAFDVVICAEMLEHIRDYRLAIAEIARVLKPGGRLGVSVPRDWPEWICWRLNSAYRRAPGGHVRIFNARALKRDIEAAGLHHRRTHGAHGLHAPYWWLQCLLWDRREQARSVALYHRFLVWDIMKRPRLTRLLACIADPLMGKSVVLYFDRNTRPA